MGRRSAEAPSRADPCARVAVRPRGAAARAAALADEGHRGPGPRIGTRVAVAAVALGRDLEPHVAARDARADRHRDSVRAPAGAHDAHTPVGDPRPSADADPPRGAVRPPPGPCAPPSHEAAGGRIGPPARGGRRLPRAVAAARPVPDDLLGGHARGHVRDPRGHRRTARGRVALARGCGPTSSRRAASNRGSRHGCTRALQRSV
jgi:hypothetical protein